MQYPLEGLEHFIFNINSISSLQRPQLHKSLQKRDGWAYLLQGCLDNNIIALIPDSKNSKFVLVSDLLEKKIISNKSKNVERFFGSPRIECYQEIILNAESINTLINIFVQQTGKALVDKKSRGGRPMKYSTDDAKRWSDLYKSGKSINDIATTEGVASNTIRAWLKRYDALTLMNPSK